MSSHGVWAQRQSLFLFNIYLRSGGRLLQCLWRSGQPVGVGSLLPTCRSQGPNSGLRGWWQVTSPFIYSGNGPLGSSLGQPLHRLLRLHIRLQFWRAENSMHRALGVFPGGLLCLERGAAWLTGEATLAQHFFLHQRAALPFEPLLLQWLLRVPLMTVSKLL